MLKYLFYSLYISMINKYSKKLSMYYLDKNDFVYNNNKFKHLF